VTQNPPCNSEHFIFIFIFVISVMFAVYWPIM